MWDITVTTNMGWMDKVSQRCAPTTVVSFSHFSVSQAERLEFLLTAGNEGVLWWTVDVMVIWGVSSCSGCMEAEVVVCTCARWRHSEPLRRTLPQWLMKAMQRQIVRNLLTVIEGETVTYGSTTNDTHTHTITPVVSLRWKRHLADV